MRMWSGLGCLLLMGASSLGLAAKEYPEAGKKIIFFEQNLIGQRNIERDTLDPKYQPEQGTVFQIQNYWVDVDRFELLVHEKEFPQQLRDIYFREHHGKKQVLYSVHPDEKEFFKDIILGAEAAPSFLSTASASPRSLITVADGHDGSYLFFNKLSVNKVLGGNVRLIPKVELARSFFVTELLAQSQKTLPKSFVYYPEAMVLIPKGFQKGGTIIRTLPAPLQTGEVTHVPFFALYAAQPDGSKPLILQMAEKSGLPFQEFYQERILKPFLDQWFELALEQGITTEPHGQNLLLEVGRDGLPTGRFVHRDFGGFTVDLEYRKKLGLPVPTAPEINGYRAKYEQGDVDYGLKTSLDLYFRNIVANLGHQYSNWFKKGWVAEPGDEHSFHQGLVKALENAYREKVGHSIDLKGHLASVLEPMLQAREKGFSRRCERLYSAH